MASAVETVLQEARARGARRVHRIVLRIGALSGVEPEALRFAFDVVTRDTAAVGAELEIVAVPALAHCQDCKVDFAAGSGFIFACPHCQRFCGELRQGRELELTRIEMS